MRRTKIEKKLQLSEGGLGECLYMNNSAGTVVRPSRCCVGFGMPVATCSVRTATLTKLSKCFRRLPPADAAPLVPASFGEGGKWRPVGRKTKNTCPNIGGRTGRLSDANGLVYSAGRNANPRTHTAKRRQPAPGQSLNQIGGTRQSSLHFPRMVLITCETPCSSQPPSRLVTLPPQQKPSHAMASALKLPVMVSRDSSTTQKPKLWLGTAFSIIPRIISHASSLSEAVPATQ